jgi:ribosomal-protein-alanine N-acetyltransferase
MMEKTIETERVLLRQLTEGDADDYHKLESDPEIKQFIGGAIDKSIEYIKKNIESPSRDKYSLLAIVCKSTNRFIGRCGLINNDKLDNVEIHVILKKEVWGRGLATETCKVLLEIGFELLSLDKIVAIFDPANSASKHICEKLGMIFRGYMTTNAYTNGHCIYEIDKRIWRKSNA